MGLSKQHPPCVLFIAAFSRYESALAWLWERVESTWGPIAVRSAPFEFSESEYYRKSMGDSLMKQFATLSDWFDPAMLPDYKLTSNRWESEYAAQSQHDCERPLNIDPGYMSMTKLVLASTKNREHRIYMREGIYAEVTLAYRNQTWQSMPWTYPDYQRTDFHEHFLAARRELAANVAQRLRSDAQTDALESQ